MKTLYEILKDALDILKEAVEESSKLVENSNNEELRWFKEVYTRDRRNYIKFVESLKRKNYLSGLNINIIRK